MPNAENLEVVNDLKGRIKIFTTTEDINENNVIDELNTALILHNMNLREMEYLYWYRRGWQPILNRKKDIRPEICNKVVVNNANMVVVFKNGYFLTKPVFYVSRTKDAAKKVDQLNEYLYTSGKQTVDNQVVNWFHTVGVGTLLVEPNRKDDPRRPVCVYALDPRQAFVVYSRRPGNRPVMGVNIVIQDGDQAIFDVFTENACYRIAGGYTGRLITDTPISGTGYNLLSVEPNPVGYVPIVEYCFDENRMSAFESAIPLMDAINTVESNRVDGIEQFIQSLAVAVNCQFPEDTTLNSIKEAGMIILRSFDGNKADFKILTEQLDQTQTQHTLDDLYEQMLDKCGVPSSVRNAGSTSDNVGAVYLRSGWAMADTHARNTEDCFRQSNLYFDEIFISILRRKVGLDLDLQDFALQFTRDELTNSLVKTQTALNLKQLGLAPEIVLARSGVSNDPVRDIAQSKKYIDKAWGTEAKEEIVDETKVNEDEMAE